MKNEKKAITQFPVLDLLRERYSTRTFSSKEISSDDLNTLFEAATWSFSAANEQPWRYIVGKKGTALFDRLFNILSPGNQPWCKDAAVLVLSIGTNTFEKTGAKMTSMQHDVGAANMSLAIQAISMNIYIHPMGGFDGEKAKVEFNLPNTLEPIVMIAMGYLGDVDQLQEPFKTREKAPRSRKSINEIILEIE